MTLEYGKTNKATTQSYAKAPCTWLRNFNLRRSSVKNSGCRRYINGYEKNSKSIVRKTTSESTDSDIPVDYVESEDDFDPEQADEAEEDCILEVEEWVLVQYATKKSIRHYVGQITGKEDDDWITKFTRRHKKAFIWPQQEDVDIVASENIVTILDKPTVDRRGRFVFPIKFDAIENLS